MDPATLSIVMSAAEAAPLVRGRER